MRYKFTTKNVTISDSTKEKIQAKIGRISRLFPDECEVFVTLSVVKNDHTAEITVPLHKRILRAEATTNDTFASIDEVVDILEKQMVKYKGRIQSRSTKDHKFKEEYSMYSGNDIYNDEHSISIERVKKFELKPMDAEEAVIEMELLGHNFYVFRNGETDDINVVYKRKNGSYGLIEPEY